MDHMERLPKRLCLRRNVRMTQQQAGLLGINCKGHIVPAGSFFSSFAATACSAFCIPASHRSIWSLSVQRWWGIPTITKDGKKRRKKNTTDISEIFLPSELHRCGKINFIASAWPYLEKYTRSPSHRFTGLSWTYLGDISNHFQVRSSQM